MSRNRDERQFAARMISYVLRRIGCDRPFTLPEGIANTKKILFVDSGDIVDLLFAAPVVTWFQERFPAIRTTFLVDADHAGAVKSFLKVGTILKYERRQLRMCRADYFVLIKKLRREGIEAVVLLSRGMSIERHLLAFACGAPTRIGFHHQLAFPFINCEIRANENVYEGLRMLRLVESLGIRTGQVAREIALPAADINHARQLIHFRKPERDVLLVGLDPGKSKSRHGVIPETIAYLANNLAGKRRVKFLILSVPFDERPAQILRRELKTEAIDLAPSNLQETIALLAQCGLFIAGNTNLFHFAAALRVPTVGLFTRYDGASWIPPQPSSARIFKGTRGEKLSLKAFFSTVDETLAARDGATE